MDLIFIDIKDLKIDDDNFKELNEIITNKEGYPNTIGSFFIKAKLTKNNNNDYYFYICLSLRGIELVIIYQTMDIMNIFKNIY